VRHGDMAAALAVGVRVAVMQAVIDGGSHGESPCSQCSARLSWLMLTLTYRDPRIYQAMRPALLRRPAGADQAYRPGERTPAQGETPQNSEPCVLGGGAGGRRHGPCRVRSDTC
jgi:hypothetical protein